jgi:excisionase family DNA binding protein
MSDRDTSADVGDDRDWLMVAEAASLVGLHPRTIERACRSGRLSAKLIRGRWIIDRAALLELWKASLASRPELQRKTIEGTPRLLRAPLRRASTSSRPTV